MARRSLFLGLVVWACSPVMSIGLAADWPADPAALLERLRRRDAEFDTRSIETEERWVERVSPRAQIATRRFDARRFGQPDPGSPPEDRIPADFDQPHRLRRLLTVREPEVTIERLDELEPMRHPEYVAPPNRGARWSSAGGVERVWSPETNALHVRGAPALDGLLRWDAHMLRWSCGHGLARWIESIDSMRPVDGLLVATGRLRLMGDDDSRFEIQLDGDLILRRAVITVPARDGNGSNEYVVETRGTIRPPGCPPVAVSGRFRRILKPAGKPESVYREVEVHFVAASGRLTKEQYDQVTRIEPGPGALIIEARRRE